MRTASAEATAVKASVSMITYNHEAFITQAIESVLMQRTDFEYELVIGEDCSTDRTREIVADYARRYPVRIRALLHEHNLGLLGQNNFVATLNACRGDYIAILDGDDYWTDPLKLQQQVDFLESHPECAICFHNSQLVYEDGSKKPTLYCTPDQPAISGLEDLLRRNFIPTASVMYRAGLVPELPSWFFNAKIGDWPMHILYAQHGDIGYIDRVMSVYRIHSEGAWSGKTSIERLRVLVEVYENLLTYLPTRCVPAIRRLLAQHYGLLASSCAELGNIAEGRDRVRRCLRISPQSILRPSISAVVLRLLFPTAYLKLQKLLETVGAAPKSARGVVHNP